MEDCTELESWQDNATSLLGALAETRAELDNMTAHRDYWRAAAQRAILVAPGRFASGEVVI